MGVFGRSAGSKPGAATPAASSSSTAAAKDGLGDVPDEYLDMMAPEPASASSQLFGGEMEASTHAVGTGANVVYDPATGQHVEEDLPADIKALMSKNGGAGSAAMEEDAPAG